MKILKPGYPKVNFFHNQLFERLHFLCAGYKAATIGTTQFKHFSLSDKSHFQKLQTTL